MNAPEKVVTSYTFDPNRIPSFAGAEEFFKEMTADSVPQSFLVSFIDALGLSRRSYESICFKQIDQAQATKPGELGGQLFYIFISLCHPTFRDVIKRWSREDPFFNSLSLMLVPIEEFVSSTIQVKDGLMSTATGKLTFTRSNLTVHTEWAPFARLFHAARIHTAPDALPSVTLHIIRQHLEHTQKSEGFVIFDKGVYEVITGLVQMVFPKASGKSRVNLLHHLQRVPSKLSYIEFQRFLATLPQEIKQPEGKFYSTQEESFCTHLVNLEKINLNLFRYFEPQGLDLKSYLSEPLETKDRNVTFEEKGKEDIFDSWPNSNSSNESIEERVSEQEVRRWFDDDVETGRKPTRIFFNVDEVRAFEGSRYFHKNAINSVHDYLEQGIDLESIESHFSCPYSKETLKSDSELEKAWLERIRTCAHVLLWLQYQTGWSTEQLLHLAVSKHPAVAWSFAPDFKSIHRKPVRALTRPVRSELFVPLAYQESIYLPECLSDSYITQLAATGRFVLSHFIRDYKDEYSRLIYSLGERIGLFSKSWPLHFRRLEIDHKFRNDTLAQLVMATDSVKLDAKCNYYAIIRNGLNFGGSPYSFHLELFKTTLAKVFEELEVEIRDENLEVSWNAWTELNVILQFLYSGERPVVDSSPLRKDFCLKNNLRIVKDKDVWARQPARLIAVPESYTNFFRTRYLPSLDQLADSCISSDMQNAFREISSPEFDGEQKTPTFFLIKGGKIQPVSADLSTKRIAQHFNVPINLFRHLLSNHLKVSDREVIDAHLGHDHETVSLYSIHSVRVRAKDHEAVRKAQEKLYEDLDVRFDFQMPPKFEAFECVNGSAFGENLRKNSSKAERKFVRRRGAAIASEAISKAKDDEDLRIAVRQMLEKELESSNGSLSTLFLRNVVEDQIRKCPGFSDFSISRGQPEADPFPIPSNLLRSLRAREWNRAQAKRYLLEGHKDQIKDGSLAVISLILENGITEQAALQRVVAGNFRAGVLAKDIYLEIALHDESHFVWTDQSLCRRHRISTKTYGFLKHLHTSRRKKSKLKLCSFIDQLLASELAWQFLKLSVPLAKIANGELPHASCSSESFAKLKGLTVVDAETNEDILESKFRRDELSEGSEGQSQSLDLIAYLKSFRKALREDNNFDALDVILKLPAISDPSSFRCQFIELASGDFDKDKFDKLVISFVLDKPSRTVRLAFIYMCRILAKRMTGNYSRGTVLRYISNLAVFLSNCPSATLELDLDDVDEFEMTLLEYLDERSLLYSVGDDARQMAVFLDSPIGKDEVFAKIAVPHYTKRFAPRNILYSGDEVEQLLSIARTSLPHPSRFVIEAAATAGLRSRENLYVGRNRFSCESEAPRIYIKGSKVFRLKTSGSNRVSLMLGEDFDLIEQGLRGYQLIAQKTAEAHLVPRLHRTNAIARAQDLIKTQMKRGTLYSLRHTFGDNLMYDALGIGQGVISLKASATRHLSDVERLTSVSLFLRSRLLGHVGCKTTLTTYFHRGFELIDLIYRTEEDFDQTPDACLQEIPQLLTRGVAAENSTQITSTEVCDDLEKFQLEDVLFDLELLSEAKGANQSQIRARLEKHLGAGFVSTYLRQSISLKIGSWGKGDSKATLTHKQLKALPKVSELRERMTNSDIAIGDLNTSPYEHLDSRGDFVIRQSHFADDLKVFLWFKNVFDVSNACLRYRVEGYPDPETKKEIDSLGIPMIENKTRSAPSQTIGFSVRRETTYRIGVIDPKTFKGLKKIMNQSESGVAQTEQAETEIERQEPRESARMTSGSFVTYVYLSQVLLGYFRRSGL